MVLGLVTPTAGRALIDGQRYVDLPDPKDVELLPWWGGLLVLLAYGGLFAAIGAVLSRKRDIT